MDERAAQVSHALGLDLGGLVLDGRYQIGRRLGAGGMAAVYEGRRVGLERRVAIKILRPELAENESNVRRFLREAKAASAISHPNVVSIEDVGGASRPVYFVMEFLDGVDLRHELRRLGRFDWPRTHDLAQQVVSALSAAHAVGIVHRDVKPANCFLVRETDGSERIKVLDFGIAKVLEDSQEYTANVTATHGIVGTVAYMAPEQARSGMVDARTDVYALGTMLYEMLAGTVPFPDKNPFVVIGRLLGEAPVPLRMHRPDLSPELDAVVMTCLEKDPDARFQSMDALGAALGGCDRDDAVVGTAKVRLPSGLVKQATVRPGVTAPPSVIVATTPLDPAEAAHATGPHATSLPGMPGAPVPTPVRPPPSGATAPQTPALPKATAPAPVTAPRSAAAPHTAAPPRPREATAARPAAAASTTLGATPRNTAIAGVLIGGIGMLALGGTATWWALRGRNAAANVPAASDRTATEDPATPVVPATTVAPPPATIQPVLVPIATPAPSAGPNPAPTTDATPEPSNTARPTRPSKRPPGTTTTTTPPSTTTPATDPPPPPPREPPPKEPSISPDLRNPFVLPKK